MTKRQKEIFGLSLILFGILSFISLFSHDLTEQPFGLPLNYDANNYLGYFGIYISYYHFFILGYTSIIFPLVFTLLGFFLFTNKDIKIINHATNRFIHVLRFFFCNVVIM